MSYDVAIECSVPQPIIDERPSSNCCTSSKPQVDESVVQDGVTELNSNACTAGLSTKSIDMIANSSRDYSIANSSKHSTSSGIDIGLHVGSAISDDLKMELLDNAWAPSADFVMHATLLSNT